MEVKIFTAPTGGGVIYQGNTITHPPTVWVTGIYIPNVGVLEYDESGRNASFSSTQFTMEWAEACIAGKQARADYLGQIDLHGAEITDIICLLADLKEAKNSFREAQKQVNEKVIPLSGLVKKLTDEVKIREQERKARNESMGVP